MALPTIFDICEQRGDLEAGAITESDFPPEYKEPKRIFENTYLLSCRRLSGATTDSAYVTASAEVNAPTSATQSAARA